MSPADRSPSTPGGLRQDALRVLADWRAPDPRQDALRTEFATFLQDRPDGMWRTCRAGHLTASTLVVSPERGEVLLTRHALVGRWLQLGGHCEPDDRSLAAAAEREAREESGVDELVVTGSPLRLDRHEVSCRRPGGADRLHHLDVQYLALAPRGADVHAEGEAPLRWFGWDALPPDADDAVRALVDAARASLVE